MRDGWRREHKEWDASMAAARGTFRKEQEIIMSTLEYLALLIVSLVIAFTICNIFA